jgi:hypothetical protein
MEHLEAGAGAGGALLRRLLQLGDRLHVGAEQLLPLCCGHRLRRDSTRVISQLSLQGLCTKSVCKAPQQGPCHWLLDTIPNDTANLLSQSKMCSPSACHTQCTCTQQVERGFLFAYNMQVHHSRCTL